MYIEIINSTIYDMKISGFTFIKNASKLYIPAKESILSVLPLVDEFVIAVGDNDIDDTTLDIIKSINSSKIKLVHTTWKALDYPKNTIYAQQTDVAMEACTGDWLIYIQGDEALHEDDYPEIKQAMKDNFGNSEVEGFIFQYKHFWGDYNHYHKSHSWYPLEIRIIRKNSKVHSWKDAQSFRKFESFDYSYEDYMRKEGTKKLKVLELDATIYHYGHVRPPNTMIKKQRVANKTFRGEGEDSIISYEKKLKMFDYGPLNRVPMFKGIHPNIMKNWISKFDWEDELQYKGKRDVTRAYLGHEKPKYRLISWLENNIFGGRQLWGFKNYISLGKYKMKK